jgi:hypothetical protein
MIQRKKTTTIDKIATGRRFAKFHYKIYDKQYLSHKWMLELGATLGAAKNVLISFELKK